MTIVPVPRATIEGVIEALLGPVYLRLLITGQPLEMGFVERLVDLLLAGLRTPHDPT